MGCLLLGVIARDGRVKYQTKENDRMVVEKTSRRARRGTREIIMRYGLLTRLVIYRVSGLHGLDFGSCDILRRRTGLDQCSAFNSSHGAGWQPWQ